MDSLLLSRITKDYLNLDPALVPLKERYRIGWGGSILVSQSKIKARKQKAAQLLALRERFAHLFDFSEPRPIPLTTAPQLEPPKEEPSKTNYAPPRYFSRGILDKKTSTPIPYLLTETSETAQARPVPANSQLLRSLCRGKGILRRNGLGLTYLDIDDRFITMMLPFLKTQGLIRPPYFNLFATPEGAHVPVIPAREAGFHYLDQIEGLGDEFSFEIEGLYSMEPSSWPEVEQVWFFKLQSEDLEKIRKKHFLTSLPGGHDFHIAIAIKPRLGSHHPTKAPLMRINVGLSAA